MKRTGHRPAVANDSKVGIGIGGMRQRIKEFGGDVRLQNANPGTLVEVIVPVKSNSFHDYSAPLATNGRP